MHHAFTSPNAEWIDTFDTDPGGALAYAYDIVCNGNEIGGGSIRIHRARRAGAGLRGDGPRRRARRRRSSASCSTRSPSAPPPHGGIAFGWDRICALLSGTDSIREVIAFPKTGGGYDPLTAAPAPITAAAAQGGRRRRKTRPPSPLRSPVPHLGAATPEGIADTVRTALPVACRFARPRRGFGGVQAG